MVPTWLQSPWLWYGMGIALAFAATVLLLWALSWDRARGRQRCPRCWYDLSAARIAAASDAWTCPECGRAGTGPRRLGRTRRRGRWACVAILLLAGAWLLAERPSIHIRGWMWLAPTWPLVQSLPIAGSDGAIAQELRRRLGRAPWPNGDWQTTMSGSQIASLFETCADGTLLARPTDHRWRASFGPFARDVMLQVYYEHAGGASSGGRLGPSLGPEALARVESAAARLSEIHGDLGARTRPRWPRGMPILLQVSVETWWEDHPPNRWIHIRWSVEGTDLSGDSWCSGHTSLKIPAEGHVVLLVNLEWVDGTEAPWKKNGRVLGTQSHRLAYDTVGSIDDILEPVASAAFEQGLAGATLDSLGTPDWRLVRAAAASLDAQTSIGLRFEYFLRGERFAVSYCRTLGGASTSGTSGSWETGSRRWPEVEEMLKDPALRVHAVWDPAWSLYNLEATKYWKGEFDITPPAAQPAPSPRP